MNILWIILIGFVAGIIAKLLARSNNPAGFILTQRFRYCGRILGDVHRADDWLVSSRSRRWTHRCYGRCVDRVVHLASSGPRDAPYSGRAS